MRFEIGRDSLRRSIAKGVLLGWIVGASALPAGTLTQSDGTTYHGTIRLGEDHLTIEQANQEIRQIPFSTLARAVLVEAEPIVAAPAPAGPHSAQATLFIESETQSSPLIPWRVMSIGSTSAPVRAEYSQGVLTMHSAAGNLRDESQSFGAVWRIVEGDFQLTARLTHLELKGTEAEPMGGLFVQENTHPEGMRAVYSVDSAENLWRITRSRSGDLPGVSKDKLALPIWLRLVRDGTSVRCYTSRDGYHWELEDLMGMRLPPAVQAGFLLCTPGVDSPASALFDRIQLHFGPAPMASTQPGLLLVNGSYLAEPIISLSSLALEDERLSVQLQNRSALATFAAEKLARVVYRPLSLEDAEYFRGRTGVLLANGDFSEGWIHSLRGNEIVMGSILLGRQTHQGGTEAVCAVFRDPTPSPGSFWVKLREGSRVLSQLLRGDGDQLIMMEPILGELRVRWDSVAEITLNTPSQ